MDKAKLLDRVAFDAQERMTLSHILDKYEQCRTRSIPTHTAFLTAAEQDAATRMLAAAAADACVLHGGFDAAERKVLFFLPPWQEEAEIDDTICHILAKFYETQSVSHRDLLGSLMGMGVARESVGDILVGDNEAHVLVLREIAPFLLQSWDSAGRTHLTLSEQGLDALPLSAQRTEEICCSVAALRLDAVTAAAFCLSRERAQALIAAGNVQYNHHPCLKSDRLLSCGDVVSAKGYGKFIVGISRGVSRKGRTLLTLQRYI